MNKSKQIVLNDAKNRLKDLMKDSEYYYQKIHSMERTMLALKEVIADLEAIHD